MDQVGRIKERIESLMACCPEHGSVLERLLDFVDETEKEFAYKYDGLNDFENYYVISNTIPGNKATKQDLDFLVPEAKKLYQKAIEQYKQETKQ